MKYKFLVFLFLSVLVLMVVNAERAGQDGSANEGQREAVRSGEHVNAEGEIISVQAQESNRIHLEAGGVSADCDCEMTQERVQNRTRLHVTLSNGRNAEVKIMPDTASETALQRLKLRVCTEERGCTIELKEVPVRNEQTLAYELKTQRSARVFGLFKARMQVQAQVDAENGELIAVKKPWWAFLASEPEE